MHSKGVCLTFNHAKSTHAPLSLGASCMVSALLACSSQTVAAEDSDVIVTVDSTNLRFNPSEVTVTEGQAVRFMWAGQALPHNAVADDGLFDSGEPARDVDYRFVFEPGTAGTHTFVCEPHASAGMVGTVIVEAAPVEVVEEETEVVASEDTPGDRSSCFRRYPCNFPR